MQVICNTNGTLFLRIGNNTGSHNEVFLYIYIYNKRHISPFDVSLRNNNKKRFLSEILNIIDTYSQYW